MMPIRRDVRFDLPAARIHDWHAAGPQVTHFFNALSVFFPVGERFFIASVRNYRERIADPELREAVTAFIGQEAMHGREHEAYNRLLQDAGIPAARLEQLVAFFLGTAQKRLPKSWQLATTLALEHHTAIIADLLLARPELLAGSDPAFRRLWQWHALEETEHKAVAYDVWNTALGGRAGYQLVRAVDMVATALAFWSLVAAFTVLMIETDPATRRRPAGYMNLAKFLLGRGGMFRGTWQAWRDYFRPSFHPWQHDNRHLLGQIEAVTQGVGIASMRLAA
ncbi:MAG TPA: metal-dependent hydrolase [Solimonas sp.]|nr:metal-dependent hydrolase [Solimonas sp.]